MQQLFDSPEEAIVHLMALRFIAESDGLITGEEKQYLKNLASLYEARYPNLGDLEGHELGGDLFVVLKYIKNRKNKMVLLQDLISMAFIDGHFCEKEQQSIMELAEQLNIPLVDIDKLYSLNNALLDANRRLAEYLFEDEQLGKCFDK